MMHPNPCASCASDRVKTFGKDGVQRFYCDDCGRSGQGFTGPTAWRLAVDNWNRNNPIATARSRKDQAK